MLHFRFLFLPCLSTTYKRPISKSLKLKKPMSTVTTHVVLFNMKDTFTAELEAKAADECQEFVGGIPGVISATFGRTFTTEHAKNYTHCLVVAFSHPSHLST